MWANQKEGQLAQLWMQNEANNDNLDKQVLELTIASNQTSKDNPYHFD